jgi:DNA-binding NarL/FixJ family response regulator
LLVDDHALFREGLVLLLSSAWPDVKVTEAADARSALRALHMSTELDLLLLDLTVPGAPPFQILREARRVRPEVPILVVSAVESRFEIDRALELGAMGYFFKSGPSIDLLTAIRRVRSGDRVVPETGPMDPARAGLTERQLQVLRLLSRGMSNKEIATNLDVAENTVKVHVATIYRALGVAGRTGALLRAQALSLLDDG